MQKMKIINTKNVALSSLLTALFPVLIKEGNLNAIDWSVVVSLSASAIATLINEIKIEKIREISHIRRNVDVLQSGKVSGDGVVHSDLIPFLFELYQCPDSMGIVDVVTNELLYVNEECAASLNIDVDRPFPKRDMRLYWRKRDLENLSDRLFHLKPGKPLVLEDYEAAYSNPLDWRRSTCQFRLHELNNGQIIRVSRQLGTPKKIETPVDVRLRFSQ